MQNRDSSDLIEIDRQYNTRNYAPLPLVIQKGKGTKVWDIEGKEYLDFLSCYSALNFGHAHPTLVSKLKEQAVKLALCSRAFYSEELCLFSKEICSFTKLNRVLPMNTGTEAIETALKVARKWGYQKKNIPLNKAKIIVAENNFHGRSISIISFSSEKTYRDEFGPYTPGFETLEFGNIDAFKNAIDDFTAAILLEPIQAEAGILIPQANYLREVSEICHKKNILLILDEIQTGLGRTGKNFSYEYEKIVPDMLVLGKSLGGGLLPLSAVLAKEGILETIQPGEHGSTFGGNPLACSIGREVLSLLSDGKIAQHVFELGLKAMEFLKNEKLKTVKEVRGKGLLMGIELKENAGGARKYCEKLMLKGVLCKDTHENVIRIAPPLIIEEPELFNGLKKIVEVINEA